jgi:hypothetical protein
MQVELNTIDLSGLDSCSTYTVAVTSLCVSPEVPPTQVIFSTTGCGSCTDLTYCEASSNDPTSEFIQAVSLGSFSNTSITNSGYTDYTNLSTLTLNAQGTYSISLTPGFAGTSYYEYFKVWIDFNGNGNFDEPEELAYNQGTGSNTTTSGTITIPSNIATGSVKMRVGMSYVGLFNTGAQPTACGTYDYGEVEDYCVTLDPTVGISDLNSHESFIFYPNPAENLVSLSTPTNSKKFEVRAFDCNGKLVLAARNTKSIDISNWNSGIYLFQVITEKELIQTKIIKQ